jgi:glycosyltransferase involved in cell wall biosynthesis
VGSILPHKGAHVLAEAASGFSESKLRLEVWGDPAIDPDYAARVEKLAGNTRLRFRGRFPEGRKSAVLQEMDVLVVPSIGAESFGLLPQEALLAGTPVIASRILALDETLGRALNDHGWGCFVEPGNVGQLRSVIEQLLAEPSLLEEWQPRGVATPSFEDHALAMEQVYLQVIGRRRRAP